MGEFGQFIPLLLTLVLAWYFLIKPQQDEQKAHEALIASLQKDDHVVTTSGLHGWIVKIDDEQIVVEIAKNTHVVLDKISVARRIDGAKT